MVITLLSCSIISCAGTGIKKSKSAEDIYSDALRAFNKKDYDEARAAFQELNAKFPSNRFSINALMNIADSYYLQESYAEAISAYREFEKLHPSDRNMPYIMHRIGMSYFSQVSSSDKDQTSTYSAIREFDRLISRYRLNAFTDDAIIKVSLCRDSLARSEFNIGNFYFRKKKYDAAVSRYEMVINKYQDFKDIDRVYFFAGQSYIGLGERDKGMKHLRTLIERFPESQYSEKADRLVSQQ